MDGFITKPFEMEDLTARVQEILEKRYGKTEARATLPKPLKSRRVLLVEDDEEAFDELTRLLVNEDFAVRRVRMAQDVYTAMKAEKPDIILMKLGTFQSLGPEIMVASRLSRSAEEKVPVLLYLAENAGCPPEILTGIRNADGIVGVVLYRHYPDILNALEKQLA